MVRDVTWLESRPTAYPQDSLVPPEVWRWLVLPACSRADAVARGRARLAAGEWPSALEVADAVLGTREVVAVLR
jgi:hypothetical protein